MRRVLAVLLLLIFVVCPALLAADSNLTIDQLIANHIKALGSAEALAAAKARQIDGDAHFEVIVGGGGKLDGKAALVSDGPKLKMGMLFNDPSYNGEVFTTDGDKVAAKSMKTGMRSIVGGFVYDHGQILREGLLGGVLSSGWALLDTKGHKAKITYDGIKKIDDRELYQVTYRPKKSGGDADIKLYFDRDFHHVMSIYRVTIEQRLGLAATENPGQPVTASEVASASQNQTRYRLDEMFSDFKDNGGLMLPTKYVLRMTYEPGNNPPQAASMGKIGLTSDMPTNRPSTIIWKYDVSFDRFVNAAIPEKVFAIQ